jgi:predicted DNA-binding transcriptional regulator YafY
MKRTERLFALAEHLRGRRTGVTAESLAERFGVTIRTMYRDLDALRTASLPLVADRGRGGGYALDRSYTLPPVNFTVREAALLLLAGRFLVQMRVIPFAAPLERALDKVRAALPAAAQRDLTRLEGRLSFVGVPAHGAIPQVLDMIERAFFEGITLAITYEGPGGTTKRRIKVDGIVLERTETLLNCQDLDKNESRQLRLHRIKAAQPEA